MTVSVAKAAAVDLHNVVGADVGVGKSVVVVVVVVVAAAAAAEFAWAAAEVAALHVAESIGAGIAD